jgi:hypothetical protein
LISGASRAQATSSVTRRVIGSNVLTSPPRYLSVTVANAIINGGHYMGWSWAAIVLATFTLLLVLGIWLWLATDESGNNRN